MRVLLLSDIHGNSDALKTVIEGSGGWDYLWVLGDLVDYGPEPHIVVDLVRGLRPDIIVTGNHDYAVAYGVDCRCDPEIHELSVYTRMNISLRLLSSEQIEWLKSLPLRVEREVSGKKLYAVHGSPRNPLYGYLKPGLPNDELIMQLSASLLTTKPKLVDADLILVGHTHIPMNVVVGGNTRVVNPGSCGQPRDGDARASYIIYDVENNAFEIHRIKYDVERVVRKLQQLQLDKSYTEWIAKILRNGRTY
ncbi:MAG: metallophosphoesterase family protein [Thermoprotei archaeon]